MSLTKESRRVEEMSREIEGILKGHVYNDMMDKSIQFVKTHLDYAKGDDYEVREYLTRELSDFINSDLDWVVNNLVSLRRDYLVSDNRASSSRYSRSRSSSRNDRRSQDPSRSNRRSRSRSWSNQGRYSRSRSRSYSRSPSGSRRRSNSRYTKRSRSRSGSGRRDTQYRYDNQRDEGRRNGKQNQRYGNRNYNNRNDYKQSMSQESINRILQELMSRMQGGQLSDASSNQTSLSQLVSEGKEAKNEKNQENCIKVMFIAKKNMNIMALCSHFKRFGNINTVTLHPESDSAIVEFSTPAEAKKALEADIPVLNDRFTEVQACSARTEAGAPEAEADGAKPAAESSKKQDEVNKKLDLIRQRQLVQLQELKSKRTGIARYLAILKQYALLWERCKDESRIPHEEKLRSVSQRIFADAQDVYRLVKSGVERVAEAQRPEGEAPSDVPAQTAQTAQPAGEGAQAGQAAAVVDNDERAKSELQKTLDEVNDAVHSTAVSEEISKASMDIMARMLEESAKEMDIQRRAFSGFRGRGRGRGRARGRAYHYTPRQRADTSKLTLDLRPNVVYIKETAGVKEEDLKNALKNCVGVRDVKMEGSDVKVVFEKHWQANKVVTNGVKVEDKVLMPILSKEPYEAPPPLPAAAPAAAPATVPAASTAAPEATPAANSVPAQP